MLSFSSINLQRRLGIQKIIHKVLNNFPIYHILNQNFPLGRQLVPKLKILAKPSPAFGNSSGKQSKQFIQEQENAIIAIIFDIDAPYSHNICYDSGQKCGH